MKAGFNTPNPAGLAPPVRPASTGVVAGMEASAGKGGVAKGQPTSGSAAAVQTSVPIPAPVSSTLPAQLSAQVPAQLSVHVPAQTQATAMPAPVSSTLPAQLSGQVPAQLSVQVPAQTQATAVPAAAVLTTTTATPTATANPSTTPLPPAMPSAGSGIGTMANPLALPQTVLGALLAIKTGAHIAPLGPQTFSATANLGPATDLPRAFNANPRVAGSAPPVHGQPVQGQSVPQSQGVKAIVNAHLANAKDTAVIAPGVAANVGGSANASTANSGTAHTVAQTLASALAANLETRPAVAKPLSDAQALRGLLQQGEATQRNFGGKMLSPEGVNMMPRPNTVYVEGAAAGVRVEPEQARLLGLRAGETINAVVTQRQDGNVLLVGQQQLPLPDRMNLPPGQVALLVRVIAGQTVLALTDPALAAQVAAANQRGDADGRFARLLNHVGSFHLGQLFSPGRLTALAGQAGGTEMQRGLASLLLDSRLLNSAGLRQIMQNTGLFGEHQASINPGQTAPGLKSMLLTLRALMQSRQMDTTSISGAIDELEARQVDSLAQQSAGRAHYSWVIPFADQYPVFMELEYQPGDGADSNAEQDSWSVDLQVGLTATAAMAANLRVNAQSELALRLWLPDPIFYRLANDHKEQLLSMLAGQNLTLNGLTIYPVGRDTGSVDYRQQRMGVSIDA